MKKCFLALLVAASFSANAEFITGNQLHEWLKAEDDAGSGYVAGVFDATLGSRHCAPNKTTLRSAIDLTLAAMAIAPSKLNLSGDLFVVAALAAKFPCQNKQTGRDV